MKPKIFKFAALLLIVAGSFCSCREDCSCSENNPKEQVCNVDNPLTDLLWLKEIIDEIKGNTEAESFKVYQCTYKYGTGFLIEVGVVNTYNYRYSLRNCEGISICGYGGFIGDTCGEFNIDFDNKKLIWENN